MKRIIITCCFTLLFLVSYSQHSERFLDFTKGIKSTNDVDITFMHFGGKMLNTKMKRYGYIFGNSKYLCTYGTQKYYDKKGNLKQLFEYDNFGNVIKHLTYDKKGRLIKEIIAKKIELTPNFNIEKDLILDNMVTESVYKEYKFHKKENKMYLFKTGKLKNNIPIGDWMIFKDKVEKKIKTPKRIKLLKNIPSLSKL